MKTFLNVLFILISFNSVYAYSKIDTLMVETEKYKLIHTYDWSYNTIHTRYEKMQDATAKLIDTNFSLTTFILINKKTNDTVFKKSSPPFTFLTFDKSGEYIICLSSIDFLNSNHIVVYNIDGDLLFNKHIDNLMLKLDKQQLLDFKKKYSNLYNSVKKMKVIYKIKSYWYIDISFFFSKVDIDKNTEISKLLKENFTDNPLTSVSRSTNGTLYFYERKDPFVKLKIVNGEFKWIKLRGVNGESYKVHKYKPKSIP